MSNSFFVDFAECSHVNYLWPQFVEMLGLEKAKHAVVQALDLQRMHGDEGTLPVLLSETCGIALLSVELLRCQIGFACHGESMVLMLSTKQKVVQLLQEI